MSRDKIIFLGGSGSGSGDALKADPLSQFAATTSLQLKGVISDETGSGALVFGTSPTIDAPTINGIPVYAGANVTTANAIGALAIDVTKGLNTKSISVDSTFTFSGAPATANTWFSLRLTNTDTASHLITIPSSFDVNAQVAAVTTFYILPSGIETITWCYDGTTYLAYGIPQQATILQNSKSAAYTTLISDNGKHLLHPVDDNNARTFTIDSNANVPYPLGAAITFINEINTLTIAITTDTLVLAGAGTTGSRSLAAMGIATAVKKTSTSWIISGTGLT